MRSGLATYGAIPGAAEQAPVTVLKDRPVAVDKSLLSSAFALPGVRWLLSERPMADMGSHDLSACRPQNQVGVSLARRTRRKLASVDGQESSLK
jgi:hypothetical protein